jgi:hypothetical protein
MIRSGVSTKDQIICIGNSIDLSNFKEVGTRNYWINRFIAKQPNVVRSTLIREPSVNSNSLSIFSPKRIIRKCVQENERDKEIKRLSKKLDNPSSRSIKISTSDKRIEYFPDKKLIVKGSGSIEDPLDVADNDTDIYSDNKNPKVKKIANKMVDYTLDKKKSGKEKLKVRRSKIKHTVIMLGDSRRDRKGLVKSELEYSDISKSEKKESSEEKDEDRSLVKRRDKKDDDDVMTQNKSR